MRRLNAAVVLLAIACGTRDDAHLEESRRLNAPAIGTSSVDAPHVVFAASELVIDELEVPTAVPVSIGSSPSRATLSSSAPDVVSVLVDGRLQAHRNGTATIRAASSSLHVTVRTVTALRIEPTSIDLAPGQEVSLRVLGDERVLDAAAVRWFVSNPTAVSIIDGRARGGFATGVATVEAVHGHAVARAEVHVRGDGVLSVVPERLRVRRGAVQVFRVMARGGVGRVDWSSSRPDVLAQVQDGLFQAVEAGRSAVCAATAGRRACADVEVAE